MGILSQEGSRHVNSIQPHLVGIDLLVPESIAFIARLGSQLFNQQIERLTIPLINGSFQSAEKQFAWVDLVEVVFVHAIGADSAIGPDKPVDPVRNKTQVA